MIFSATDKDSSCPQYPTIRSRQGTKPERQILTTPSPQPYPMATLRGLEGLLNRRGGPHDVPWRHLCFQISGSQENQDIVYPAELSLSFAWLY